MQDEDLIIRVPRAAGTGMIEIVRAYTFKLNMERVGGPQMKFESRDFFMSAKMGCEAADAESLASRLQAFCKTEVLKSVREQVAGWRKADEVFIWTDVAKSNGREVGLTDERRTA